MLRWFRDFGFRKKLLLSYLLIVILPIFCIVILVVNDMTESLKRSEKENMEYTFRQSLLTVDNFFDGYISLARSLQVDSDLINYLNKSYPDGTGYQKKYAEGKNIQTNYQTRLIYESLDGDSIRIFTSNQSLFCTGSPFFHLSDSSLQTDWYRKCIENPAQYVVAQPTTYQGYKMVPIAARLTSRDTSVGILLVETRASRLCSLLQTDEESREFLVINSDGIILASRDPALIASPMESTGYAYLTDLIACSANSPYLGETGGKLLAIGQVCAGKALSDCRLILISDSTPQDKLILHILSRSTPLWVIVLALDILMILLFSRRLTRRISRLVKSVRGVTADSSRSTVILEGKDEIAELSRHIKGMTDHINTLAQNVYESELQVKDAQIHALQSQINPHFLFNFLQAINTSALKNKAYDTSDMIVRYARLIRQSLAWHSSVITLGEELELARDYLQMQKERFSDRFVYSIEIGQAYYRLPVPKFCIQPLVENAVIHGGQDGRKVSVRISFHETHDSLQLTVSDTGMGIEAQKLAHIRKALQSETLSEEDAHIGILNVHRRIRLLYGDQYGVSITSEEEKGTLVTVRLPRPQL